METTIYDRGYIRIISTKDKPCRSKLQRPSCTEMACVELAQQQLRVSRVQNTYIGAMPTCFHVRHVST